MSAGMIRLRCVALPSVVACSDGSVSIDSLCGHVLCWRPRALYLCGTAGALALLYLLRRREAMGTPCLTTFRT